MGVGGGHDGRVPESVVLLHGFTQTGASWDPVIAALGERYRALAPDLRGHGRAAAARPIDFDAVVDDVATLSPECFVLVGYSMGGRIALHVALAHPKRVARLVLIGATAGIEADAERASRRAADMRLAEEVERDGVEAFARRWAAQPLFVDQPAEVAAEAQADRLRNTAAGLAAALRGIGTGAMAPLWERLTELTMPILTLTGERDGKFRALAERIAAAAPYGEHAMIPGAGHAAQLEAPAAVARWVSSRGRTPSR